MTVFAPNDAAASPARKLAGRLRALLLWLLACSLAQAAAAQAGDPARLLLATEFGAVGDLRPLDHLSFRAGTREVHAPASTFAAADVGRTVFGVALDAERVPVSATAALVAVSADGAQATLDRPATVTLANVRGGLGTDNADALQRCWDQSTARGLVCFVPAGQFLFAKQPLRVRRYMSVEGSAPEASSLVCAPVIRDCVGLDDGPVQFVSISRLELRGTEGDLAPPRSNATAQRGFHLIAHGTGEAGGGLWQSSFAHVQVSNFWGDEFALEGGKGETMHPNQFLFFEDLELQAARGAPGLGPPEDSYRLRLSGQNAQIQFLGGQIHGSIGSQLGKGVFLDGVGVVRFEGTTCEWLDNCLDVRNGVAVRFADGWIENVKRVATLGENGVRGFSLEGNYLANACYDARTHGGWCVRLASAEADTGTVFAHNFLAWGTPPDALVLMPPGAAVSGTNTLQTGASADAGASSPAKPTNTGISWRRAKGRTPWIGPGASATVHLAWAPAPFATADFTASCVTYGAPTALQVKGIVRQNAAGVDVMMTNTDPRQPQRGLVECIALR